jgi:hypothetical protein
MLPRLLVACSFLLVALPAVGQDLPDVRKDDRTVAAEELEAVILDARKLDNKAAMVTIRSRAAMLVSFSDPARSESMFLDLWKFVNAQSDSDFDKQQARTTILKFLFPRNPKLARQLLAEKPKPDNPDSQDSAANPEERESQTAKLAGQLIESDPSTAASLLEKSLATSPTTAGVAALLRLREADSSLGDYVAAKTLDTLTVQPSRVSLSALQLMTAYTFPGSAIGMPATEAESSLQALQFKYFVTGYEILKGSLGETNEVLLKQGLNARDLQLRAVNQAMIAGILAALAPRLQPSLAAELQSIAAKLAPQMPPNLAQFSQLSAAKLSGNPINSEDAETNFAQALSNGDYDEARRQLDRINDAKKRELYGQLVFKVEARTLLGRGNVLGAVESIRKIEDQTTRLIMYLDALKSVKKKHDDELTRIIVNEARLLIPQTDRNGVHVQALLSFVSQLSDPSSLDDAFEFLSNAVTSINALGKKAKPEGPAKSMAEAAMAELNDPNNLLDSPEMEQAFSSLGLRDLYRGLAQARRIDIRPLQLVARLETIQGVLKSPPPKSKPKPKAAVSG